MSGLQDVILYKRLYLILCIFAYYIIYNSNAPFVFMIWIFVHDARICPISHFKAFCGLLASGSIITLDAQKNAVCAICIFYTLQYSLLFRYFNNIFGIYIFFCCFCNRWFNIYMRILKRFMYIILLIIIYNLCRYVCDASPPLASACIAYRLARISLFSQ